MRETPEREDEINRIATARTLAQVREEIEGAGAGLSYRIRRLKELAEFKAAKPFSYLGDVIYSDPLDFPDVQLKAIHELNLMDGAHAPVKSHVSGEDGGPVVTAFSPDDRKLLKDIAINLAKKKIEESSGGAGR